MGALLQSLGLNPPAGRAPAGQAADAAAQRAQVTQRFKRLMQDIKLLAAAQHPQAAAWQKAATAAARQATSRSGVLAAQQQLAQIAALVGAAAGDAAAAPSGEASVPAPRQASAASVDEASSVTTAPVPAAAPATAQPTAPPAPTPPPKDALARAGDGRVFWRPAPAGAAEPPAADKAWLDAFLRFYRAGPPNPAAPDGSACSFNGARMAVDAALDIVDAQAVLNGRKPNRSTAASLLQALVKEGAEDAALGDEVAGHIGGKRDLNVDIAKLEALPMPRLLAVLDRMKAQKQFEPFTDRLPGGSVRMGAAIATVRGEFEDILWQSALPKLSEADRAAVMLRAPAKLRRISPGPAKPGDKPEEPVDVEAVVTAGKDGVQMQVKLTAHSPLRNNIGETEFTVTLGADGKLGGFELDVTAFQATLMDKGSVAEITVSVSGNASMEMAEGGARIAPDGINVQLQAELAARLTRVPVLKGVTVKLTANYGTAGGALSAGLEFRIPGT